MSKGRNFSLVLVSLVLVFALAGIISARTYDYTNLLLHKAYEGYDDNKPADVLPDYEAELSSDNYTAISASDESRASYSFAKKYEFHRFEFKIDEAISDITQIYALHEGWGGSGGHTLYIWNYTNSEWEPAANTTATGPPDQILSKTFTSGFSHYIEGGYLQLLAQTNTESSSCPYLYVWNGTDYIFDNDIIPFKKPHIPEGTDYYRIPKPLQPDGDFYKVRIAEELRENSYLDLVRLMAIDHPADVDVYPDIEGNLFTIKNPMPPVSCVDDCGNDCLELITGKEGYAGEKYYTGSTGSYLVVDFGDLSSASIIKLVMATDYSPAVLGQTAIQTENAAGEWETRISFSSHEFWATNVFDITGLLPDGNGEYKLRFYFTETHSIDYIAIDTSEEVATTVNILHPVYAESDGDVLPLVADSDDNYVFMTTGDELFLKFPYEPMSYGSDFKRDFVCISEGYYETEPHETIHTDYVKVEITTPIDSDGEFTPPIIDGNFDEGEWTNAQLLIEDPIHTYVYFKNDNYFLYVCVDAANLDGGDYTQNDADHCDLFFDTGHDEVWTLGHEDWFRICGDGTTEHHVAISPTYTYTQHCTDWALNHPGLEGAAGFGTSPNAPADDHRIYEFKIPLSLLGASPGDTIGFASPSGGDMTVVEPPESTSLPYDEGTGRHNVWPLGAEYDDLTTWGDLVLASVAPPPPPVGGEAYPVNKIGIVLPWVALGLAIMAGSFLVVRRRRAQS